MPIFIDANLMNEGIARIIIIKFFYNPALCFRFKEHLKLGIYVAGKFQSLIPDYMIGIVLEHFFHFPDGDGIIRLIGLGDISCQG